MALPILTEKIVKITAFAYELPNISEELSPIGAMNMWRNS